LVDPSVDSVILACIVRPIFPFKLNRRTLLTLVGGGSVAGWLGCGPPESPREGLVRLLGLKSDEIAWLDILSDAEQSELHASLSSGQDSTTARTVQLVARVLTPRSRLFAFVGYPAVADRRTVCDGILRE
jgi:hypothetical protein